MSTYVTKLHTGTLQGKCKKTIVHDKNPHTYTVITLYCYKIHVNCLNACVCVCVVYVFMWMHVTYGVPYLMSFSIVSPGFYIFNI